MLSKHSPREGGSSLCYTHWPLHTIPGTFYQIILVTNLLSTTNTTYRNKSVRNFLDAMTRRLTRTPYFLISCNTEPHAITTPRTIILPPSPAPATFLASTSDTSTYETDSEFSFLSLLITGWFSPRRSLSQMEMLISSLAIHATSSSDTGRVIQSPLYFALLAIWFLAPRGLKSSSRFFWGWSISKEKAIGFMTCPPKKFDTTCFSESTHFRASERFFSGTACSSASARRMNSCNCTKEQKTI